MGDLTIMADKQISQLVAATTINNDDLFVMQQGGTAKKLSGQKLSDFVYQSAADQIERVNEAVEQTQAAVDYLEEQKNEIAQVVADMAQLGTDTTLSTPGMAADAKATGEVKAVALARFEQKEISGVPIATFDDGADDAPVKALTVSIDPVQDLHGYSNPWPAGGSKNLLPIALETLTLNGITATVLTDADGNKNGIRFSGTRLDPNTNIDIYNGALPAGIVAGGSYIFSWGYAIPAFQIITYDSNSQRTVLINQSSLKTATVTIPADAVTLHVRVAVDTNQPINITIYPMARLSTVSDTTFVPYTNICPITGFTEANITRTSKNLLTPSSISYNYINYINGEYVNTETDSRTGWACTLQAWNDNTYLTNLTVQFNPSVNNYAYITFTLPRNTTRLVLKHSGSVKDLSISIPFKILNANAIDQTFTLSYYCVGNNPSIVGGLRFKNLQLELGSSRSEYQEASTIAYPITFPSEAGTVYGGTLDVTKGKLTVDWAMKTFDGSETNWIEYPGYETTAGYYQNAFGLSELPSEYFSPSTRVCNILKSVSNITGALAIKSGEFSFSSANYGRNLYFTYPQNVSSITDMKALVTETPMQVCYKLASPVLYDLTPTEVTTLLALNNIWADTGNILDLIYRKEPITEGEIQEQIDTIRSAIATAEDSGVASTNYSIGALILVGSNLVEVTSPIAQGESIVIGSNCQETTVAAQIAYLKSIVDGIGNLAYLSYENA